MAVYSNINLIINNPEIQASLYEKLGEAKYLPESVVLMTHAGEIELPKKEFEKLKGVLALLDKVDNIQDGHINADVLTAQIEAQNGNNPFGLGLHINQFRPSSLWKKNHDYLSRQAVSDDYKIDDRPVSTSYKPGMIDSVLLATLAGFDCDTLKDIGPFCAKANGCSLGLVFAPATLDWGFFFQNEDKSSSRLLLNISTPLNSKTPKNFILGDYLSKLLLDEYKRARHNDLPLITYDKMTPELKEKFRGFMVTYNQLPNDDKNFFKEQFKQIILTTIIRKHFPQYALHTIEQWQDDAVKLAMHDPEKWMTLFHVNAPQNTANIIELASFVWEGAAQGIGEDELKAVQKTLSLSLANENASKTFNFSFEFLNLAYLFAKMVDDSWFKKLPLSIQLDAQ